MTSLRLFQTKPKTVAPGYESVRVEDGWIIRKKGTLPGLIEKHYAGKHDQKSHGNWASGGRYLGGYESRRRVSTKDVTDWTNEKLKRLGKKMIVNDDIVSQWWTGTKATSDEVSSDAVDLAQAAFDSVNYLNRVGVDVGLHWNDPYGPTTNTMRGIVKTAEVHRYWSERGVTIQPDLIVLRWSDQPPTASMSIRNDGVHMMVLNLNRLSLGYMGDSKGFAKRDSEFWWHDVYIHEIGHIVEDKLGDGRYGADLWSWAANEYGGYEKASLEPYGSEYAQHDGWASKTEYLPEIMVAVLRGIDLPPGMAEHPKVQEALDFLKGGRLGNLTPEFAMAKSEDRQLCYVYGNEMVSKHYAGKHDQQSHGRRGGVTYHKNRTRGRWGDFLSYVDHTRLYTVPGTPEEVAAAEQDLRDNGWKPPDPTDSWPSGRTGWSKGSTYLDAAYVGVRAFAEVFVGEGRDEGKVEIGLVETRQPHRRKGYASALVSQIRDDFPDAEFIWHRSSDAGGALMDSLGMGDPVNKHYPGKHDQKTHGSWARGRGIDVSDRGVQTSLFPEMVPDDVPLTPEELDRFRNRGEVILAVDRGKRGVHEVRTREITEAMRERWADTKPTEDDVGAIFEVEFEVNGQRIGTDIYDVRVTDNLYGAEAEIRLQLVDLDTGAKVGDVHRYLQMDRYGQGTVGNASFFMNPSYKHQGIGLTALMVWEHNLSHTGAFTTMELQAVDDGRYVWPHYGFDFKYPPTSFQAYERLADSLWKVWEPSPHGGQWSSSDPDDPDQWEQDYADFEQNWVDSFGAVAASEKNVRAVLEVASGVEYGEVSAYDIVTLGGKGEITDLGAGVLDSMYDWGDATDEFYKEIWHHDLDAIEKSGDWKRIHEQVFTEWMLKDAEAVETLAPRYTKALKKARDEFLASVAKHYPDKHDQKSHGNRGGGDIGLHWSTSKKVATDFAGKRGIVFVGDEVPLAAYQTDLQAFDDMTVYGIDSDEQEVTLRSGTRPRIKAILVGPDVSGNPTGKWARLKLRDPLPPVGPKAIELSQSEFETMATKVEDLYGWDVGSRDLYRGVRFRGGSFDYENRQEWARQVVDQYSRQTLEKHYPGLHDQQSHGNWATSALELVKARSVNADHIREADPQFADKLDARIDEVYGGYDVVRGNYKKLLLEVAGTPESRAYKEWYTDVHKLLTNLSATWQVDQQRLTGAAAAVSTGMQWDQNKMVVESIAALMADGYKPETGVDLIATIETLLGRSIAIPYGANPFDKAAALMRGGNPDDVLSGPKVRSFYNNMLAMADDPNVTIDAHMIRSAAHDPNMKVTSGITGTPGKSKTVKGVKIGEDRIGVRAGLAKVVTDLASDPDVVAAWGDLLPRQVQSIIWSNWVDNYKGKDEEDA